MIRIETTDPRSPDARRLLEASHAMMDALFDQGDCHYLSLEALTEPAVSFYTATTGAGIVGCGALARMDGYAEVKSMFTDPAARRQGIADALLRHIEATARSEGIAALKLETGDVLTAARAIYARHGFSECSAFGSYPGNSRRSIFMEKALT